MADIQAQVRQTLDNFKAQVQEAAQQVNELESLMSSVEDGFGKLEEDIKTRMADIDRLFAEVAPLIQDLSTTFEHEHTALMDLCQKTDQEFESDGTTLEQDVNQWVHGVEEYVAGLGDHDTSIEQAIQDAKHKADEVIQKAKDTAQHIGDQQATAVHTVVDEVHGIAQTVESTVESTAKTVQQTVISGVQALTGHGNDLAHLVQDQANHLGDTLKNDSSHLESEMKSVLQQFEAGFTDHMTKLLSEVEQLDHAISGVMSTVSDLAGHGVETVGTMSQAAESTNVGLNEVIGIVKDVKDILDEVGL